MISRPDRIRDRSSCYRFRGSYALGLHLAHLGHVNRRWPATVDPCGLGVRDALKLALSTQIGVKLREHTEHIEEALAGKSHQHEIARSMFPLMPRARALGDGIRAMGHRTPPMFGRTRPVRRWIVFVTAGSLGERKPCET